MLKTLTIVLIFSIAFCEANLLSAQSENRTPTYPEIISYYHRLDSLSTYAKLIPYGKTDIGLSLQLFVISRNGIFDPRRSHELGQCILMINNGIHPGEPDGINASMTLAKDLLENPKYEKMLEHVVVCIIPAYNIDGMFNRSCCSRANQDGPEEYGFRGNAQNLDLNRDFIKCDASNTQSWIKIFRQWDPDVLIDTHVSDGADYQYTMSFIASQHNKLHPSLGHYTKSTFTPILYSKMKDQKFELTPYVDTHGTEGIPDSGINAFLETPRFITGYAALFNTFGFLAESHMLKPFPQRVKATYSFLLSVLEYCSERYDQILPIRAQAKKETQNQVYFPLNWELDTTTAEPLNFKGYTAAYKPSKVSGLPRLYYDHEKPFEKKIKFYDHYIPTDSVESPLYYVVPQAWHKITSLLEMNGVRLIPVETDSVLTAEVYYIDHFTTVSEPYEGHYLHKNTSVRKQNEKIIMRKGDYLVPVFQEASRFVVECLEPKAIDSYFNWGFFDAVLQQKEWFSPYVFEDVAEKILEKDTLLKNNLEQMRKTNPEFAKDGLAQLNYVYNHSEYMEKSFRRYPVFRILRERKD